MTVVGREARRRWALVLGVVAVLVATPVVVSALPSRVPAVDPDLLRQRIAASADRPYEGFAQSAGALGLPELPRLGAVTALLSGTTRIRTWYAARDRWRVDVVDTGVERGLYRTPEGEYTWDYGANQLTYLRGPVPPGVVRLPRAADLAPPDLARRLLAAATGDPIGSIAGRRIAGVAAAGLRVTPADPRSTLGHVDIWADPDTGLPLRVEVTARGAERPVMVTNFLDLEQRVPADRVLVPPARREGLSVTTVEMTDTVNGLVDRSAVAVLPGRLAGQPRRDPPSGASGSQPDGAGLYGTGLAQVVVVPLGRQVGGDAYRSATAWGAQQQFTGGTGALLGTPLLSVLVLQSTDRPRRWYLVTGMVDSELLRQVGADLLGATG